MLTVVHSNIQLDWGHRIVILVGVVFELVCSYMYSILYTTDMMRIDR